MQLRLLFLLTLVGFNYPLFGQVSLTGISVNHVPIVVKNLQQVKTVFTDLGFKIKNGREHEGINNCFIKFQDGTYLEFVEPIDSKYSIGKYYTDFLKNKQGATALAIDVQSTEAAKLFLSKQNVRYTTDSNSIWQTINPEIKETELFYIEYANKNWKDKKENTTHNNGALQLNTTWFLTKKTKESIKKYTNLGFESEGKNLNFGMKAHTLRLPKNKLILLEASPKLPSYITNKSLEGICGFTIKTSSVDSVRKFFKDKPQQLIVANQKQTLVYFSEYNFFIEFVE